MTEKNVTVRIQKVKKNRMKGRLIFFLVLAAALLLIAFLFARRGRIVSAMLSFSRLPPSSAR